MRCFYDFKPGGSLCHIFATMYRYRAEQCSEKIEFGLTTKSNNDNDRSIALATEIEEKLIDVKCFRLPTVYIRPEVDHEARERIIDILKKRQGEVTENEEDATHIIYPETEIGEDYARPVFKRGKYVMIHWYRKPESYDSWVEDTFDLPVCTYHCCILYSQNSSSFSLLFCFYFMFGFQDDIVENISPFQDVWRIAANWVLDLEAYNEWMAEEDYEVDEKGAKKVHPHRLMPEDLANKRNVSVTKRKRGRSTSSARTKSKTITTTQVPKLPTTQCPICKKTITVKALKQHLKEKHGDETFKCNICGIHTKRESALQDHQRRKHFEPTALGRPKKNSTPRRKRSPFRGSVFEARHGTSIKSLINSSEMEKSLSRNNEQLIKISNVLEKTLEDNENTKKRLKVIEDLKHKEENENQKIKSRLTILESRQKDVELPNIKDIPSLLKFLNLSSSPSKNDIRTAINLRLMEVSSESNISHEIFTSKKMSKEKKLELTIFYNKASEELMKWFKNQNK